MNKGWTKMNNDGKKLTTSAITIILRLIGLALVTLSTIVIAAILLGDLVLTIDPETGNKTNGPEDIIPDLIIEWRSILILIAGIICLYASHKISKKKS